MLQRYVLQNTSKGHKLKQTPTCDPGIKYNALDNKSATSYDCQTKSGFNTKLPPPLLTLPTHHTTATHPAPSPTHYHTAPPTQCLTSHQTTVPLYPNEPPFHDIPYTTSSSLTLTQSLQPPQTTPLTPKTHYPTFPHFIVPPQYPRFVRANDTMGAQL